jgi:ParB family chromosome partitioning protein
MSSDARVSGRRALGRGLGALLATAEQQGSQEIEIDRLQPDSSQPRRYFDAGALEDLAESIREHGIVQPLLVRNAGDDRYRLILGERRLRAAHMAGLSRVPVIIADVTDQKALELAIIENVQRSDLNPVEQARAYERLIQEFGLSQADVARRVGKSRTAVANTLRILGLPPAVLDRVIEGAISEGHARAILGIAPEATRIAISKKVESQQLSVRQTEDLVRRMMQPGAAASREHKSADVKAIERELQRALGSDVSLKAGKRGGHIVIDYFSDEEFQGLYERLTRSI